MKPAAPCTPTTEAASAAVIASAIEAALAPHMASVVSMQQNLVALLDRVGLLEMVDQDGLADAKRRRLEEERRMEG